jgi:hypothetical protein
VGLLVQGQEFNTTFLLSSSDPIIRSSDQQISRSAEDGTANSKQQTANSSGYYTDRVFKAADQQRFSVL